MRARGPPGAPVSPRLPTPPDSLAKLMRLRELSHPGRACRAADRFAYVDLVEQAAVMGHDPDAWAEMILAIIGAVARR